MHIARMNCSVTEKTVAVKENTPSTRKATTAVAGKRKNCLTTQ